jgi:MFS family permease
MVIEQSATESKSGDSPTSLWRDRDFLLFWTGESVSGFGSQITLFALPVAAVVVLHASGGQLGLLKALFTVPYFVFPIAIGIWLDRRTRRPVMLAANIGRAALVLSIPVAAWLGGLAMPQVYLVALLGGALTAIFDVAYVSYVPALVGRARLAGANSRLQASDSVATLSGPGLGGLLVGLVGAASALVTDAISYLVSFGTIAAIGRKEAPSAPRGPRRLWPEIRDGLRAVFGNPPLRQIAFHAAIYNGFFQLIEIAFIIYALNDRHISPGVFGLIVTVGGVGGFLGSVVAAALLRRIGPGRALLVALSMSTNAFFLLPVAHGRKATVVVLFAVTFLLAGIGAGIANVVVVTVRQSLTPDHLMARMNASYRVMNFGVIPIGSAIAGVLIGFLGPRTLLWLAPFGLLASVIPVLSPAVRRLRELPEAPPAQAD